MNIWQIIEKKDVVHKKKMFAIIVKVKVIGQINAKIAKKKEKEVEVMGEEEIEVEMIEMIIKEEKTIVAVVAVIEGKKIEEIRKKEGEIVKVIVVVEVTLVAVVGVEVEIVRVVNLSKFYYLKIYLLIY